jgi:hypothetical protein
LRKATPQKKTLKRSKKSPSVLLAGCLCVEHRTVRWHTGLSGAHTSDCPVHQGTTAQRLVPGGTRREDHWTVRCGKPAAPTITCSDRATARHTGQATMCCPVHHRIVQCTTGLSGVPQRSNNFSPTALFVLGAINTPPIGHFQVWEPKRHTKTYSRHFQVLLHPSA